MALISGEESRYRLLTILVSTVLLLATVVYPFALDHNIYQSMAWQLVRFHQLPELGSWDTNWPGVVLIHSLSILLFGNSVTAFRVFDGLMHVGMALLIYSLLLRWISPRRAFYCILVVFAFFLFKNQWNSGERDGYVAFLILCETLLLYKIKDRTELANTKTWRSDLDALLIGILAGLSIVIRPTNGLLSIVLAITFFMLPRGHRLRLVSFFCLGSALVLAAVIFPYALVPNGLRELYLSCVRFNLEIYALPVYGVPFSSVSRGQLELLTNIITIACIFGIVLELRKRRSPNLSDAHQSIFKRPITSFDLYLFTAYYLAARLSIIVMAKYWRYQYEGLLILLAVLFALLIEEVMIRSRSKLLRRWGLATVAIILVLLAYPWPTASFLVRGLGTSHYPIGYARDAFAKYYSYNNRKEDDLRAYVQSQTKQGDRIEQICTDPNLYWSSELQPASRFTTILGLGMKRPVSGYTEYQLRWRRELIDSLASAKPLLIIVSDSPSHHSNFLTNSPHVTADSIPGFDSLLSRDYVPDTVIHYWEIFRRKYH